MKLKTVLLSIIILLFVFQNINFVESAIADSKVRRYCLYFYEPGTDTIYFRFSDLGTLAYTTSINAKTLSPAECFKAAQNNWWFQLTQDARVGDAKAYNTASCTSLSSCPSATRFIDRSYWTFNHVTSTDNALLTTDTNKNFEIIKDLFPAGTSREATNYFLSFFPNFPSMYHRLSYVVTDLKMTDEASSQDCTGNSNTGEKYPQFMAKLKLYGSKEAAEAAFNAYTTGDSTKRALWFDHVNRKLYPVLDAAEAAYKAAVLCPAINVNAHVVVWWNGTFLTSTSNNLAQQTYTNLCGAGTGVAGLCNTTPAPFTA